MDRHPNTSLPVLTPSTIHHSRLTFCLTDSLDLDRCLSILFWLSECEYAGSCDFAFVGALEIRVDIKDPCCHENIPELILTQSH